MPRRPFLLSSSLCASVALVAGGVAVAAAPAHAETAVPSFDPCAEAFPAGALVPDQKVTGLTTAGRSRGSATTPETFTGTYLDTITSEDGDILVFDLEGSRITKGEDKAVDAGIWSGISGSPVYAADGRLVGAVAYSFGGWESSTIAGVTPAADMYALRDHRTSPEEPTEEAARVMITSADRRRLMAAGASSESLGKGARRIPTVSAITLSERYAPGYATIAQRAKAPAREVAGGGSTGSSAPVPIVPGGNLAVADAYGSISAYGLGTATAVCGDEVIGFGHPMDFRTAPRTIHGASTSFIQPDNGASFKVANLGAPQGRLLHDGLAGILGRVGDGLAGSASITSTARATRAGATTRTYRSTVPNPEAVAEIAATHAFRDAVLAQDQIGGGESIMSWTVAGNATNEAGETTPVTLKRTQRYSSQDDLAQQLAQDIAADVYTLQDNEFDVVDVTTVTINDSLSSTYRAQRIGSVEYRSSGSRTWKTASMTSVSSIKAKPGTKVELRIHLVKADKYSSAAKQTVTYDVVVPKTASGTGRIDIAGGYHGGWYDEEEYYDDLAPWEVDEEYFDDEDPLEKPVAEPTTAQGVADLLQATQRHDSVRVSHDFNDKRSGLQNLDKDERTTSIVSGSLRLKVSYR